MAENGTPIVVMHAGVVGSAPCCAFAVLCWVVSGEVLTGGVRRSRLGARNSVCVCVCVREREREREREFERENFVLQGL